MNLIKATVIAGMTVALVAIALLIIVQATGEDVIETKLHRDNCAVYQERTGAGWRTSADCLWLSDRGLLTSDGQFTVLGGN